MKTLRDFITIIESEMGTGKSPVEIAAEKGWKDAVVAHGTNENPYPEGSPEHAAYENGFQNGLEELD